MVRCQTQLRDVETIADQTVPGNFKSRAPSFLAAAEAGKWNHRGRRRPVQWFSKHGGGS